MRKWGENDKKKRKRKQKKEERSMKRSAGAVEQGAVKKGEPKSERNCYEGELKKERE